MKILIVDDDKRIRKMMTAAIADLATEVIECSDGDLALDAYARHLPDWVLMDLNMPNVDGITATYQIHLAYPYAKIVIVTSYDSTALRQAAESAGAVGYILKDNLADLAIIIVEPRPLVGNVGR